MLYANQEPLVSEWKLLTTKLHTLLTTKQKDAQHCNCWKKKKDLCCYIIIPPYIALSVTFLFYLQKANDKNVVPRNYLGFFCKGWVKRIFFSNIFLFFSWIKKHGSVSQIACYSHNQISVTAAVTAQYVSRNVAVTKNVTKRGFFIHDLLLKISSHFSFFSIFLISLKEWILRKCIFLNTQTQNSE